MNKEYEKCRLLALTTTNHAMFPEDFEDWLAENMHIWDAFVAEAMKVRARGFKKYSTKTIVHFLRHHTAVAESGAGWKINNNHSPYLARLFDLRYPSMAGMWEYRTVLKPQGAQA